MRFRVRVTHSAPAALVLACVLALGTVGSALACTVAERTPQQHWDAADLVFTGTAVRMEDSTNGVSFSSSDPVFWTFVVDGREKGEVPNRLTVATAYAEASCGYSFELGQRYRVYASESNWYNHLATGLGDGNRRLPPLADRPPVEGEFHTVEYHLFRFWWLAPAALATVAAGLWWLVGRVRRASLGPPRFGR